MKQIRLAARIARQIRQTETTMDQTILEANALVSAMIEARREGNFAAEVGQEALEDVVRSIKALMDARGAIVAGHSHLAKLADDLAIEWRMDGPLEEKIKEPPLFQAKERDAA
jgi:hypothetical protein